MNALPQPAYRPDRPHAVVIGAGPGGLAAAMLLSARGLRVTVLERDPVVGGRTRTIAAPGGYRFDLGPTFFLYPRILSEIFRECGAELEREVEMMRLDPQYRLIFEGKGSNTTLDATPDLARMEEQVARLDPRDAAGVRPFMEENRRKLTAFRPVLERAFTRATDVMAADMLRALPLMRPGKSVDGDLRRHFRDPRTRLAFSFQTKYLGMSPFRCPSLFTILSFLEYEHGVFHVRGGIGRVSEAMARVAEQVGADIRLGTPVERVVFDGKRATGVVAGGRHIAADAVVMNADFAHAMPQLVPESVRARWNDGRIAKARYSCSTFMLYLGVEGTFPGLAHHSILLSQEYQKNIRDIEAGIVPEIPSLYVQHAAASDPSMAPPGHSALYVLVPVPNMLHGQEWSEADTAAYRRTALDRIRTLGITDIEDRIRYEKIVTPRDWRDEFAIGFGATFNLAHDLRQMLFFRPGNRFNGTEGLYLVGGGTHPGSGLPVIYEGARISAGLLLRDLGLAPVPTRI
ncbi:phytoene desaturase family protein [Roseomonas sp. CCTCC AB2023176]|uniref:phytoene desaturase family protein n=1 Tax=Roseomonas sp. CCTCC AB2023176 TaxID=3342640 RepID=UPI0035D84FD8